MTELDKIIDDGKVNASTAMVVFAVELRNQGQKLDELKAAINSDDDRYLTIKDASLLDRRITRLEKAALWVLGSVFTIVMVAVIGLVIIKPGGS